MPEPKKIKSVEEYTTHLDPESKQVFQQFRELVKKLVPECSEKISYGMPAFEYKGILVWFAVWKSHYGLYPHPAAIKHFAERLKNYQTSKGCIQLPKEKALPVALLTAILKFRLKENIEKDKKKKATKLIPKK